MPALKKLSAHRAKNYWKIFLPFLAFLTLFKFGGGLHYTLMAPFGEKVFPLWLVGAIIGVASIVQMLLDMPAGDILDRLGYKKLLKLTTALFFCASAVFLFGPSPASFIFTLLIGAFGWLFFGPGTSAYTMVQAPKSMIGRFVATHDVFASLGIVLSSIAMIYTVKFRTETTGLILCGIFLAAFIAISLSPADKSRSVSVRPQRHRYLSKVFIRDTYRSLIKLKPVSFMLISTSLVSSTFYAIIWFVVPILLAHTDQTKVLGLGLGVFDFSVVLLGFFLGKIVDAFNKKVLVVIGLLVFAISGTLLGFNLGFLFILLGFIAATGEELTGLSLWAWLYQIDKDKKHYGLLSGAISFFDDIGWSIGPLLAGILYSIVGPAFTIALGGFLVFVNLFVFYLFVHPFAKQPMPHPLPPYKLRRPKHKH